MTNEELMLLAIEEAKKSTEPLRCGVVISKDGIVISKSFNNQRASNNATSHAEINAIGEAGRKLGNKNLIDCIAFCTCEPCTMCLSAMIFSKVTKIYFGSSLEEVALNNLPINLSSKQLLGCSENKIEMIGGLLRDKCDLLYKV